MPKTSHSGISHLNLNRGTHNLDNIIHTCSKGAWPFEAVNLYACFVCDLDFFPHFHINKTLA